MFIEKYENNYIVRMTEDMGDIDIPLGHLTTEALLCQQFKRLFGVHILHHYNSP